MTSISTLFLGVALALAASAAGAQDAPKADAMSANGNMASGMTMQQCKDRMAMHKPGMKEDDAAMMQDKKCDEMMKSDSMMQKDSMIKKDGMASSAPAGK